MLMKVMLMGTACFLLIQILPIVQGIAYSTFLATTLPQLCPYSTFCTVDAPEKFRLRKKSPCCQPCSCDDDCLIFGTCCPDFPAVLNASLPAMPVAPCSLPVHYSYDEFNFELEALSGFAFYYITSGCPKKYKIQHVINKCVHPNKLDMTHRVLVSDDRGRVFFNRYCAQCNGVSNIIYWKLKQMCKLFTMELTNASNVQALTDNNCLVISVPPTTEVASASRCYPSIVNTCNVTGRWKALDSNVIRACESTKFQYLEETVIRFNIYRNPYCYLCNEDVGYDVRDVCTRFGNLNMRGHLNARFSGVLKQMPQDVQTHKRCTSTEVYDDNFGKCRSLHCPITLTPKDGKCVEIYETTEGLSVLLHIKVTPDDANTKQQFEKFVPQDASYHKVVESLAAIIMVGTSVNNNSCGQCQGIFQFKADGTASTLTIPVSTTRVCSIQQLFEILKKSTTKRRFSNVIVNGIQVTFSTELQYNAQGTSIESTLAQFRNRFYLFANSNACPANIPLKPLFYCAYVELNKNDYDEFVLSNGNRVHLAEFALAASADDSGDNTKSIYKICVNKYFISKNVAGKSMADTCVSLVFNTLFRIAFLLLYK